MEILPSIMPILLLLGMGYYMQKKQTIKQNTIDEVKNIVLNIALPALLFLNYKNMDLAIEHLGLTVIIFLYFCLLYAIGVGVNKIKGISIPLLPFLMPGCAFGVLGIPLYATVFGIENLPTYSILGIGHEFFIWFFLIIALRMKYSGEKFSFDTIIGFIKNPFIIAVFLGMTLNITGLSKVLNQNFIYQGIEQFLEYLGSLVTPLILIIIGYGIKLNKKYTTESMKILLIRVPLVLLIGYITKIALLDKILIPDPFFDYAWATYIILPPSYVMALFIEQYSTIENGDIAKNTIVLNTLVSLILYIMFVLIISPV